jgi:hypothetical protein
MNKSSVSTAQIAVAPANLRSPIRSLAVAALFSRPSSIPQAGYRRLPRDG